MSGSGRLSASVGRQARVFLPEDPSHSLGVGTQAVYFEKIRVFKAGLRLNTLAWNNRIGLWCYFVGLWDRSND